jgi:long-chain acyl-CoA synthetase
MRGIFDDEVLGVFASFQALLAAGHLRASAEAVLIEGETRWTFLDFEAQVRRLASALAQSGVAPGDRVGVLFLNQKEYLVCVLAIRLVGAVVVPVNGLLAPEDILYVLSHAGVSLLLTTQRFAPLVAQVAVPVWIAHHRGDDVLPEGPAERAIFEVKLAAGDPAFEPTVDASPETLALLIYTSGTTGRPKGVMLSEHNILANLDSIHRRLQFTTADRILMALPLFHAYGLTNSLYAMSLGCAIVLVPSLAPKTLLETLVAERITILPLVPTLFTVLVEQALRMQAAGQVAGFPDLRLCVSGGAALPVALLDAVESTFGMTVLEGYGLTETAPVLAVNDPHEGRIPGSVGKLLDNVQLSLRDDANQALPMVPGQTSAEGEICVAGPNVMLGYYHDPEATAQVIFEDAGTRWFRTGDLGHVDAEGHVVISGGRKKELIIRAGENIAPVRIEMVLYQHPAMAAVAVVGLPDTKLGEKVVACLQLKPGAEPPTSKELRTHCAQHLAAFMVPDEFHVLPELPKNPAGKILKAALKAQLLEGAMVAN